MRIAQVSATFPPYFGGAGNVCYHYARELARRGHDVTVFTAEAPAGASDLECPGFALRRLRAMGRLGNAPLLPGLLGLHDFDLVHLHLPFIFGAELVWLASVLRDLPYVVTYHNDLVGNDWRRLPFAAYNRLVLPPLLRRARRVIVTSRDYFATSPSSRWPAPDSVSELPLGVDVERFESAADGEALRRRYDLDCEAPVVLFVAALDRAHYFKGLPLLLAALRDRRLAGARCLVVGDGELRPAYRALASSLGLGERVRFAGRVPDAELAAHYALADLLVLPSTDRSEAFGLVLLEAMAAGKPVVASRLPGVRTLVDEGVDGCLVEPGDVEALSDAIAGLLDDSARAQALGRRGRAKVRERYAWPVIGACLEQVYAEALS